ncbi:MAG TPA: hypothetical protein VJS67_08450 [Pseudonocardiaceae bacterium]|nr:hypothetical protein [Pseudonocardiaceae bacterium]
MTAVATTSFAIPRLTRRARSALLTAHITVSVGWLGLDGALVALEVTGLGTGDPSERAGIAAAMAALVVWVLVPVVAASLLSGLVLALSTPWGLVRYWWVIIKCGIAGVLTAAGLVVMLPRLHQIIIGDAEPVGMQLLIGRAAALALLLVATGLSVVKPWGKTPRGRSATAPRQPFSRSSDIAAHRPAASRHPEPIRR